MQCSTYSKSVLLFYVVRDDVRIIRTCGWEDDEKKRDCYKTVLEEYNTYVCSCETEYCNGAESRYARVPLGPSEKKYVDNDFFFCCSRLGWSVMFALLPAAIVLQLLK